MKIFWRALALFFLSVTAIMGQDSTNDVQMREIRNIDQKERDAVLMADVSALTNSWAEDFVVNAPNNQIVKGRETVLTLVREGILDYASFEREVDTVKIYGDVAVLMGLETVKPKGKAPFAGQTVRRRFTNVWMKRDGRWQLTARQATIIGHDEPDAKKAAGDFSKQMADTMVKGDTEALKAMLSDDWRVTTQVGTIDKDFVLAGIKAGTLKYVVMDKSKVEVRVYGDAAVVTGTIRASIMVDGRELTSADDQFTEVLVKKGGKWQCVTVHASPAVTKDGTKDGK